MTLFLPLERRILRLEERVLCLEQKDQKKTLDTLESAWIPSPLKEYDDFLFRQLQTQILRSYRDVKASFEEQNKP